MQIVLLERMKDLVENIEKERNLGYQNMDYEGELSALYKVWEKNFPENSCVVEGVIMREFLQKLVCVA